MRLAVSDQRLHNAMKTYPKLDTESRIVFFEVGNSMLPRRAACRLVSKIDGVSILRRPGLWPFRSPDVFCQFALDGQHFELWEPFGDNSRIHIAANPLQASEALDKIHSAFQLHRPISGITRWVILIAAVLIWYRYTRH